MKGHGQVYDGQRKNKPDTGAHAEAEQEEKTNQMSYYTSSLLLSITPSPEHA